MNTGTPIKEVTIPTGIMAPATMALLKMEAKDMINAPERMLAGSENR